MRGMSVKAHDRSKVFEPARTAAAAMTSDDAVEIPEHLASLAEIRTRKGFVEAAKREHRCRNCAGKKNFTDEVPVT